jgi:hypothetical protein
MKNYDAGREDRETVRQMLVKRYHGAIEVTDEMIDAVLSGLASESSKS